MEIIGFDQSTFLPLQFILDNILIMHETNDWAGFSRQPLIFMKLEFSKAYDMIYWPFLFRAMGKLGFSKVFVDMTGLLFQEALVTVNVNGSQSASFIIERGVHQGCLLAPYLFLFIAEALNAMFKDEMGAGSVKGIKWPTEERQ
jgi:hypothetical protein